MAQDTQTDLNRTETADPGDNVIGRQVLAWLEERAEALSGYGIESELTLRETAESSLISRETEEGLEKGDVVWGIMLHYYGLLEDFDIFVTLLPCDTDEGDAFLLSLSHYREEDEKLEITGWSFPLTDYPEAFSEPEDFLEVIILFKKICAGETLEPAPAPEGEKEIPEILYELPRLQALFEQLNEAGAEPELLRHEQGRSYIRIFDGELRFELSYLQVGEGDAWILRAELFGKEGENGEEMLLLRFDIPEFGGFSYTADYGRLLEIMEVIASREGEGGGRQ